MASIKGLVGRLRGDDVVALNANVATLNTHVETLNTEVASLHEYILHVNHLVTQLHETVNQLNHDVRSGAESSLPLFLGYSERLRLDADTAISATQVIERQLALLDERLAAVSPTESS